MVNFAKKLIFNLRKNIPWQNTLESYKYKNGSAQRSKTRGHNIKCNFALKLIYILQKQNFLSVTLLGVESTKMVAFNTLI